MSGATQEFCVRWNSHLGSIGAAFPQLLAGQRFVDVTLACEGHQVHCHRLVLAACSTYFEAILAENPCKHPVIILPSDIKLWEIQALVDFMYKGEVNVTQAGLGQLLRCAEQLRIRGLYGSEAAVNYKQLQQMRQGVVCEPTVLTSLKQQSQMDSTETDDTATNSTTSTTTISTATASSVKQQQQQHKEQQPLQQRQQTNGSNALQLLQQQQQLQRAQQSNAGGSSAAASNNSNAPTEDDSADDTSNNWNMCSENYEDYKNVKMIHQQQHQVLQQQQHHLDSTIEDDHNYVAAHEEDNDSSMTGVTGGGNTISGNLSLCLDTDPDNSANSPGTLMHSSIDGYTSYKRVRRSEASLAQAAKCVSKGDTFQTVSNMFNIPVSTIRFYMARKGILPKRKRGRGASNTGTITSTNAGSASAAAAAVATMAAASALGSLSTAGAHHLPHGMLDATQLKQLASGSGNNSPATTATSTTLTLTPTQLGTGTVPGREVTTAAGVPFHLVSDAVAFKQQQPHRAHMI
ncbi:protein tramtrack, beta isoform [Scaptodrosophila lebanonensis]|uniref:Protein tramtrack, beta isoform n=1 Tax=Drosophila lebanonensis TaxID=7225 RepID=A0A6J2U1Y9_DROLE|nr:protein tramtrack, beta isoform [Scaptodrosophila lebanonensis]XP_030381493.1 protein tramtrack, beta isoform [Scaptodrosophila lebanonensis]